MTRPASDKRDVTALLLREPCGECHAMVGPGEYHPHSFCVLVKAGYDPWQTIRLIAAQLQLGDPGDEPPKVWEIHKPEPARDLASGKPSR